MKLSRSRVSAFDPCNVEESNMLGKWDHLENIVVRLIGAIMSIALLAGIVNFAWSVKQPADMIIPAILVLWWAWFLRMALFGNKAKSHFILNERNLVIISAFLGMWFVMSAKDGYERRLQQEREDPVAESMSEQ